MMLDYVAHDDDDDDAMTVLLQCTGMNARIVLFVYVDPRPHTFHDTRKNDSTSV